MPPGSAEQPHCHEHSQQLFFVLSGTASFEVNGRLEKLFTNESLHVPPKVLHRVSNLGSEDLSFLAISAPESHGDRIDIIEYSSAHKEYIKTLNVEWLQRYFTLEPHDVVQLNDPDREIIEKEGKIFYARWNNEIVGTVALMKVDQGVYELGKMAVTEKAQGHGIGAALLQHCLNVAAQSSIRKLLLYSNTRLQSAVHLYRKYGFREIELEEGRYGRANIKMEKVIQPWPA
jgi:N-acetylglutamate synthase-like GNAT family acetyltransferase